MSTVDEIATEFGFEVAALRTHLELADALHAAAQDRNRHDDIAGFATAVKALSDNWQALGDSSKWLLDDYDTEPAINGLLSVAARAVAEADLLKGEVKTGPKKNYALIVFADCIKEFWSEHRNDRFGCLFEKGKPQNDASRFLVACADRLHAGYSGTNCEQAMRKVNEGERIGWRKRAAQEDKRDLAPDQAKALLDKFVLRKRN